mmetsp:Transcript_22066/g.32159  ORF Transcript_22066/g.32159 Transcript_22066/m.32159 type:complete len:709 (+) Transcript_22066:76-2202(+)
MDPTEATRGSITSLLSVESGAGDDPRGSEINSTNPKEITIRAVVLSIILAILLGAANVYLGLFAGLTVSASIPAAIISMSLLRTVYGKDVGILENNLVQTAASAGESLAAGVIFTFPALVIMNDSDDDDGDLEGWSSFHYAETVIIAMCGGMLGIMFSIPIRRALILDIDPPLAFPEGVACANVLLAGEEGGSSALHVTKAAGVGGLVKILESTNLAANQLGFGGRINDAVFRLETNISAALVGVGYIVGWKIAAVFLLGGICNWLIAIPIGTGSRIITVGQDGSGAGSAAHSAYEEVTRYLGVGAMLVGGIYALISLRVALWKGIEAGIKAFRMASSGVDDLKRTERDLPLPLCAVIIFFCIVPFYIVVSLFMKDWGYTILLSFFVVVFGFFASAIAAYMAGLVGSSNNPISGVTVCVVLVTALVLRIYLGTDGIGPPTTIYVSAMIACAGSISGDNMQDLKTGHIIGATPWKQQVMLILGVLSSAVVMPPILNLLNDAYGFGTDGDLPAPQASLMDSVSRGVILGGLPWGWVATGGAVAVLVISIDRMLAHYKIPFAMPVLGFAVGFYLPLATGVPIMAGALVSLMTNTDTSNEASEGVLFAGGLITGEALMGITLAIPIAASGSANVLHIFREPVWYTSIFVYIGILYAMYWGSSTPSDKPTLTLNESDHMGAYTRENFDDAAMTNGSRTNGNASTFSRSPIHHH